MITLVCKFEDHVAPDELEKVLANVAKQIREYKLSGDLELDEGDYKGPDILGTWTWGGTPDD